MRIVDIREISVPISRYADPSIPSGGLTTSMVAVVTLGGLVHVTAGAVGVSALLMASAEAFTMLKLLGAAYLVWLVLKAWREARVLLPIDVRAIGSGQAFREGVIVETLNWKTAAYFLAFMPLVPTQTKLPSSHYCDRIMDPCR